MDSVQDLLNKKLTELIHSTKETPFARLTFCNFVTALESFFEKHGYDIDETHMVQEKKFTNKQLVSGKVQIQELNLDINMEAFRNEEGIWCYTFNDVTNSLIQEGSHPIPSGIPLNYQFIVNHKRCVFFALDIGPLELQNYIVPIEVAEELQLFTFNGQQIKKNAALLSKIKPYKVPFIYSYSLDK